MKFFVLNLLFCFGFYSVVCATQEDSSFNERDVINKAPFSRTLDGVYHRSKVISSGSTVYFGMEEMTRSDVENWGLFACHALNLSGFYAQLNKSFLNGKTLLLTDILDGTSNTHIADVTGFQTNQQLEIYAEKFQNFVKQYPKLVLVASNIGVECHGFFELLQENNHIIYASRKPITQKYFQNGFVVPNKKSPSLDVMEKYFSDIIMVLESRHYQKNENQHEISFENRGIFRNPWNVIEDGPKFSGLSLMLYGFRAHIPHSNVHKEYMYVSSASAMTKILVKQSWKAGDLFVDGKKDAVTLTEEEKNDGWYGDTPCKIKISALRTLFDNFH